MISDPTGNWAGFDQDDNGEGTWDLEQDREHNMVNEIDVDEDHSNTPGASITASTAARTGRWATRRLWSVWRRSLAAS